MHKSGLMDYEIFLNSKPLYYDEIDYKRFPNIYEKIKSKLNPPKIIHIIGTNGKGSSGRFLTQILSSCSKVGHYTSPHIFDFSERLTGTMSLDESADSYSSWAIFIEESVFIESLKKQLVAAVDGFHEDDFEGLVYNQILLKT